VHRGTLDDLDGLRGAAETSDGVILLAFKHDLAFSGNFEASSRWRSRQLQRDLLAGLLALDSPASSALTREQLGWQPTHPTLLEDLDEGDYFEQTGRAAA
jgi:hypothetical protein